jgi:cell division protein FtsZ
MGRALIGSAVAQGPNAAVEAVRAATNSPLLEDTRIKGARQVLMNITASGEIGLHELNEACSIIREAADCDDLQLNFGVIAKETMGDSVKVTVIATGFTKPEDRRESVVEAKPPADFFAERAPESAQIPLVPEPMPAAQVFEEELDVPAYLRQGKLLN